MKYLKSFEKIIFDTPNITVRTDGDKIHFLFREKFYSTDDILTAVVRFIGYTDCWGGNKHLKSDGKDLKKVGFTQKSIDLCLSRMPISLYDILYWLSGHNLIWNSIRSDIWKQNKDVLLNEFSGDLEKAVESSRTFGELFEEVIKIQKKILETKIVKKRKEEIRIDFDASKFGI